MYLLNLVHCKTLDGVINNLTILIFALSFLLCIRNFPQCWSPQYTKDTILAHLSKEPLDTLLIRHEVFYFYQPTASRGDNYALPDVIN